MLDMVIERTGTVMPRARQERLQGRRDWQLIVDHMAYTGSLKDVLTGMEQWDVYCQADGFGLCSPTQLREINGGWDWSHIRDSTPEGCRRMVEKIREIRRRKGLEPEP